MIRFEREDIYTREDLEAMLAGQGLEAERFLRKFRPTPVWRNAWRGAELNAALEEFVSSGGRGRPAAVCDLE